jgi:glycosyltransferase involved in cell wall biosynthesis
VIQATDAAGANPVGSATTQDLANRAAAGPVRPMLSICLITYNRVQFLESLLQRLIATGMAGLNYEIVLCDNCSTDTTMALATRWAEQHPQIRYFRQDHDVGALNNLLSAYRLATGSYAIYLADDDLLIPEAVAEAVRYLEQHAEVVVAHAPWEMWDDVAKQAQGHFYRVEETRTFARGQALELANFVIERHIFPEICIYRTAALHRMYVAPSAGFWPFVYLAICLNFGEVAFLKRPFYRSVTRHSVGLEREQMGAVDILSKLDSYRVGLEVLFNAAYRFQGLNGVPAAKIEIVQRMIRNFIAVRVQVAIRFLKKARNFTAAAQYLSRLQAAGAISDEQLALERQQLAGPMLGQTIVELCTGISMVSEIVLCDVEGAQSSVDLLRTLKPQLPVRLASMAALLADVLPGSALVLTSYAEQRERLIEAGYPSGLVVSEQELLSVFGVY